MPLRRFVGYLLAIAAFLIPMVAVLQAQTKPDSQQTSQTSQQKPAKSSSHHQYNSEGERIFAQNCSRCHATPEGFPPSISGTVVRHMRVRASLSDHDVKELLRFFNP